jgi:cell division protein FtsB
MSSGRAMALMLSFGLLVFAFVGLPLRIFSQDGYPRYDKLRMQLARTQRETKDLERRIAKLRMEVSALTNEPSAVERIARDELGLVREGELLFQFPPDDSTFLTNQAPVR